MIWRERAEGVLLGLACGDALGRPVEFRSPEQIRAEYGELTEMGGYGTHGQPAGTITDDTEMALCIARSLAEQDEFNPGDVAERFIAWYNSGPFDIGLMTADALMSIDAGTSWETAGEEVWEERPEGSNAGNGSVMRCAPYAIAFADDPDTLQQVSHESSSISNEVEPKVFGEMVHRLCELRPAEEHWADLMEQTLVDEGSKGVHLTEDLYTYVRRHAERGIDYVDEQTTSIEVEAQHDELYVTAEFERGEISGYIDHLIVTPDAYHIIDYKTGAVSSADVETDAAYYQNQMKAYAVALQQQGTERTVHVSLLFTAIDEVWETEWSPTQIQNIERTLGDKLTVTSFI